MYVKNTYIYYALFLLCKKIKLFYFQTIKRTDLILTKNGHTLKSILYNTLSNVESFVSIRAVGCQL